MFKNNVLRCPALFPSKIRTIAAGVLHRPNEEFHYQCYVAKIVSVMKQGMLDGRYMKHTNSYNIWIGKLNDRYQQRDFKCKQDINISMYHSVHVNWSEPNQDRNQPYGLMMMVMDFRCSMKREFLNTYQIKGKLFLRINIQILNYFVYERIRLVSQLHKQ